MGDLGKHISKIKEGAINIASEGVILAEGLAEKGIEKAGNVVGVDVTRPELITNKLHQMENIISNPAIKEEIFKTKNLRQTLDILLNDKSEYSIAWIDAKDKKNIGKGIVYLGNHSKKKIIKYEKAKNEKIYLPSFFLNKFTNKLFNFIYYNFTNAKTKYKN